MWQAEARAHISGSVPVTSQCIIEPFLLLSTDTFGKCECLAASTYGAQQWRAASSLDHLTIQAMVPGPSTQSTSVSCVILFAF